MMLRGLLFAIVALVLALALDGCLATWPADKCTHVGNDRRVSCSCRELVVKRVAIGAGHRWTFACDAADLPLDLLESR